MLDIGIYPRGGRRRATMAETGFDARVAAVRRFNRFYTKRIGLLHEGYLESPFSLREVRVLSEPAHGEKPTASELAAELGLDAGYLSRILHRFEKRGLVTRRPSKSDGRQSLLSLTAGGRKAFAPLHARSHGEIGAMLARLSAAGQGRLLEAMHALAALLGAAPPHQGPVIPPPPHAGDMGWVVHRHGALYAQED